MSAETCILLLQTKWQKRSSNTFQGFTHAVLASQPLDQHEQTLSLVGGIFVLYFIVANLTDISALLNKGM